MIKNPRNKNPYYPFLCREDAITEYNSLRIEILESQKQRVGLLTGSLAFIGAFFSYLVKDGTLLFHEAALLIFLTVPSTLYAYSTRLREHRIASYIHVFMPAISPWSGASSKISELKLNFLQRASTSMISGLLILDLILLYLPFQLNPSNFDVILFSASSIAVTFNVIIFICTQKLRNFIKNFEKLLNSQYQRPE
jgi:hypothetical protein